MKPLFSIILLLLLTSSARAQRLGGERLYEVATLTKFGTLVNVHFLYSVAANCDFDEDELVQVHIRLDKELEQIASNKALEEFIRSIDSIGVFIDKRVQGDFVLKNLSVIQIDCESGIKEKLIERGLDVSRVKESALLGNEHLNFAGSTEFNWLVKSISDELSVQVFTKHGAKSTLYFTIAFLESNKNNLPVHALSNELIEVICDSLAQFEVYELWASKRASIEKLLTTILKSHFPETYTVILNDVVIPEEAEKQFQETDRFRSDYFYRLFEINNSIRNLRQSLEENNTASSSEIQDIENEMNQLEKERELLKKRAKQHTYEYRPQTQD